MIENNLKKSVGVCDSKVCIRCGEEKLLSEFHKHKQTKDGLNPACKKCLSKQKAEYRLINREILNEKNKIYYLKNKEIINEKNKIHYLKNKEIKKEKSKIHYKNNREKIRQSGRDSYQKNKLKISEYHRKRRNTEPLFKMKCNLRSRTSSAFKRKRWHKNGGIQVLLGCDYETAFLHLENQFTSGMNWDNYGQWHIDHIIPLSSANNEQELKQLCHYTNLQPLWAEDNLSKYNKL